MQRYGGTARLRRVGYSRVWVKKYHRTSPRSAGLTAIHPLCMWDSPVSDPILTSPSPWSLPLILKATLPKNNLKKLGSLATVPGRPGRIPAFEK